MRIPGDNIHLIVIVYAWTWLCHCGNSRNAKIDSELKHPWRCVKMTREVSHCGYVNVNEYPGIKQYPSTARLSRRWWQSSFTPLLETHIFFVAILSRTLAAIPARRRIWTKHGIV
jgi:hypothetical protein